MFHFTALAERQTTGPGPYGYDTKITSRGKSHIPAATIAGRYPGKGWRSFLSIVSSSSSSSFPFIYQVDITQLKLQ